MVLFAVFELGQLHDGAAVCRVHPQHPRYLRGRRHRYGVAVRGGRSCRGLYTKVGPYTLFLVAILNSSGTSRQLEPVVQGRLCVILSYRGDRTVLHLLDLDPQGLYPIWTLTPRSP